MPNWTRNYLTLPAAVLEENSNDYGLTFTRLLPTPDALTEVTSPVTIVATPEEAERVNTERNALHNPDGEGKRKRFAMTAADRDALVAEYGASDWYDWDLLNWGTKWDTDGSETLAEPDTDGVTLITFETPWTAPTAFLDALAAKYPEALMVCTSIDEDGSTPYLWQSPAAKQASYLGHLQQ